MERYSLTDILVLAGGTILPAPAMPASTRISARLKRAHAHSSRVGMNPYGTRCTVRPGVRGEFDKRLAAAQKEEDAARLSPVASDGVIRRRAGAKL